MRKKKIKVVEEALYYIAGEYMIYRVLGGQLSMMDWLKEYSDIEEVIGTEDGRNDFITTLGVYYTALFYDVKWPHREG